MKLPTRKCIKNEIRSCSQRWEDAEVKAQCEAYTARACSGWKTYRNRHCLLCNNVDVPKQCYSIEWGEYGEYEKDYVTTPHTFSVQESFTMLLDWRRLKTGACASSEIYDPLSRVCRKVFM